MNIPGIGLAAKGLFLRFKLYVLGAVGVGVLLLGVHDRRVDYLRGRYLDRLNAISIDLTASGYKPKDKRDPGSSVREVIGDLSRIKAAQAAAAVAAEHARLAQEALYNQLAEKADERVEAAKRNAMDAADRYIAAHRVRPQAAGSAAGRTAAAGKDSAAQGSDGPGEASKLAPDAVAVSADDIRICTENTTRLDAVHDWALGLAKASGGH